MPPRKSNVSAAAEDSSRPPAKPTEDDGLSVEDLNLPKSIVQRLAKGVLPPNTQVQKDALLAMSKGATVFVNYITNCAAEHAARSGKKTVMPKDVLDALQELEFDFMLQRVEAEVNKFTSIQADKRNTYRKKVREEKKAAKDDPAPNGAEDESPPPAKRARRSDGAEQNGEDEDDVDETVEDVDQDDEEVEDDEVEEDAPDDEPTEDLLEEREKEDDDDEMADGDESD
ncbi:histone-fold-containing protein [Bimuria novae-zelandiae CBS 107.79]|uniref:DNA polymerase epsilon subunit D n=1 Tax=Bimuria novae-zelandiae CBS 107.79 TaxID=1447943 RepID=A0A6A5VAF4_9PLEO|nr:histone-fold-containing protein [Bimuria novae-zelandiae CBS 107.79]